MKFDINRDMRRKIIIYSLSLGSAIVLFALISHLSDVVRFFGSVLSTLAPFLFGLAFAFLLNKPMEWFERLYSRKGNLKKTTVRLLAVLTVLMLTILGIALLIMTVVPSLIESFKSFMTNFTSYSATLASYITYFTQRLDLDAEQAESLIQSLDLFPTISEAVSEYLPRLASMGMEFVQFVMNAIIALAACFYLLLDKDSLLMVAKKLNYSLFSRPVADYLSVYSMDVQKVFEQYIVSNLVDSLTVGMICYAGCLVLRIPYAPMIGFVIGITNIIPVFGPFLGAIPVIVILLLIDPWYAVYFAVFILILQQVDGNVLKPIIMGDRMGISGFWILFSVTVGGSLFGIIGMFLGVPVFALLYAAVRDFSDVRLEQKNLAIDSATRAVENTEIRK